MEVEQKEYFDSQLSQFHKAEQNVKLMQPMESDKLLVNFQLIGPFQELQL